MTNFQDRLQERSSTHYYAWKNNIKRLTLYKHKCRVIKRLKMNSVLIEFEDGQREVVSRNAIRKLERLD